MAGKPAPGPSSDWRTLLKDKRFLAAGAVVVVVGLVVLVRRRTSSGSAGTGIGGGQIPTGSSGYVQGGADTTGTDVASFLSQYSGALQGQLNEYGQQLNTTLAALRDGAGDGGAGSGTSGGGLLAAPASLRNNSPGTWRDSLQVGWDRVPGAVGYRITSAYGDTYDVGDVDAYQIGGLIHNGSYFYTVQAKDAGGKLGAKSALLTAHTKN